MRLQGEQRWRKAGKSITHDAATQSPSTRDRPPIPAPSGLPPAHLLDARVQLDERLLEIERGDVLGPLAGGAEARQDRGEPLLAAAGHRTGRALRALSTDGDRARPGGGPAGTRPAGSDALLLRGEALHLFLLPAACCCFFVVDRCLALCCCWCLMQGLDPDSFSRNLIEWSGIYSWGLRK